MMLAGRYVVGPCLGAGTWFTVYKAEDTLTGRLVVAKMLHEELAESIVVAEDVLATIEQSVELKHRNIVMVHDAFAVGGSVWQIDEYIDGRTLFAWLREGLVTTSAGIIIFRSLLQGVEYAHSKGAVHGCLDPTSIRIAVPATAKVADFGLTALDPGLAAARTRGTLHFYEPYWAPETRAGEGPTAAGDVYTLGTLLEALVRDNNQRTALQEIVAQATALHPEVRYQSAAELRAALDVISISVDGGS
ncbi:hypothetical protein GCM10009789_83710 [Kribbella sancticallisti]|uniref:non-specific serine/threonine protein kinase n=1 Tax=Kribbella sancticallisti TaxID=460087 RepID=A0ABN2EWR2_9ACTN